MCIGWFCYAGRSVECLAAHHISCFSSIGQIDVKIDVTILSVESINANVPYTQKKRY